jgi:hypothetical protein
MYSRSVAEQKLEEAPAVIRRSKQIRTQMTERRPLKIA